MATARKTAASTTKTTESATTPAPPTTEPPTSPRTPKPKQYHVLYRTSESGDIADARTYGDRSRAWEDLATTHSGADGWMYVAVEVGASLSEAIAATKPAA